jgi:hypothetical protein
VPRNTKGLKRGGAPGRPKGVPNKLTMQLKDMILEALVNKGGVSYLEVQAVENPNAFLTLVGKVLPIQAQVQGHDGGAVEVVQKVVFVVQDASA